MHRPFAECLISSDYSWNRIDLNLNMSLVTITTAALIQNREVPKFGFLYSKTSVNRECMVTQILHNDQKLFRVDASITLRA